MAKVVKRVKIPDEVLPPAPPVEPPKVPVKKSKPVTKPPRKPRLEVRVDGIRIDHITGKVTRRGGDRVADFDYILRLLYDKEESPFVKVEGVTYDNVRHHECSDRIRWTFPLFKKIYAAMGQFLVEAEELLRRKKVKPSKWQVK